MTSAPPDSRTSPTSGGFEDETLAEAAAAGAAVLRTLASRWRAKLEGDQVAQRSPVQVAELVRRLESAATFLETPSAEALTFDDAADRMRLLVDGVKDAAIFMLDADGRVTSWNAGAERINGYRADEVLGQHFSLFYPPDLSAAGAPARELGRAIADGRWEEEGWRQRKTGERYWANVVLTAVLDPNGRLRGVAKVTRDLTEHRRMEQQAARATEAQDALKSRDEFISVAAHELRTPLTALQLKTEGVRDALKKAAAAPHLIDRLGGAVRQIGRLTELVDRLLDVSRVVRGTLVLSPTQVDLAAVVRSVADDLRDSALQVGSELRVTTTGDVTGRFDKARMEQALVNLISNAIKYGSGNPIDLRVEQLGQTVRIEVCDHGIGIAEADLDRIFSRFERAAPLSHYSGLGLGLYVARSLVELHGGTIRVASAPGEGSTFSIEVPKQTQEKAT